MITNIATVAIYTDNQEKALQFWTEKMGFEQRENKPMGPNGNWIEVAPKNAQTRIVIYPKSMMPKWAEMKASLVFECENIQQTYTELHNKGVEFVEEPKKMQWGTFAIFKDLDGNEYVLKQ
ncbi:VOC family protein [Thermoflavimicrobium daqui]|uniref:VOC domain-containing protein n=1 Tax=Thermoflavimicrobium daqui TaxID=2137476 RepID=A0A364K4K2_9BACL|nr:VOC family protein [Thermoflavimicrobium daqui]RAL24304.1 hypothetical protein DL897_11410 [Thermoflavimicrobium daqui]